jgi:hypothetical protein
VVWLDANARLNTNEARFATMLLTRALRFARSLFDLILLSNNIIHKRLAFGRYRSGTAVSPGALGAP